MLGKLTLALALPALVAGQLSRLRGTIPGALHQCEATNLVLFDSANTRPVSLLFLPSSDALAPLRSGTISLTDATKYNPLQIISGIDTPDAQAYDFTLKIATDEVFEVFAFLPDGSGKALSLTRTVMTALPGATNCNPAKAGVVAAPAVTTAATVAAPIALTVPAVVPTTTAVAAVTPLTTKTRSTVTLVATPPAAKTTSAVNAQAEAAGLGANSASTLGASALVLSGIAAIAGALML